MDEYFLGVVKIITENKIIFETNKHGYNISGVNLKQLKLDVELKIYIYFYPKPTKEEYFGFLDQETKLFFIQLLNVSSVGPKTALKLLNQFSLSIINLAISKQDVKVLQQCKGVTQKIASNIISYFSNKQKVINSEDSASYQKWNLVFDTLLRLGFKKEIINNHLLTSIDWKAEVETIIATAIKGLNSDYY